MSIKSRIHILGGMFDLPNFMTIVGLLLGVASIVQAVQGHIDLAVLTLTWAAFMDWSDGRVARMMPGRGSHLKDIGKQLDSLSDLVTGGVAPALILIDAAHFTAWSLFVGFVLVACGALRLSYFNVFGMGTEGRYTGVPITENIIALSLCSISLQWIDVERFAQISAGVLFAMAILNVSPIRYPKLGHPYFIAFSSYTILLTLLVISRRW